MLKWLCCLPSTNTHLNIWIRLLYPLDHPKYKLLSVELITKQTIKHRREALKKTIYCKRHESSNTTGRTAQKFCSLLYEMTLLWCLQHNNINLSADLIFRVWRLNNQDYKYMILGLGNTVLVSYFSFRRSHIKTEWPKYTFIYMYVCICSASGRFWILRTHIFVKYRVLLRK